MHGKFVGGYSKLEKNALRHVGTRLDKPKWVEIESMLEMLGF